VKFFDVAVLSRKLRHSSLAENEIQARYFKVDSSSDSR
jgi:hypothetical protein